MKLTWNGLKFLFGTLILLIIVPNCTKEQPKDSQNEPHLDGWKIESYDLGINIMPTRLLFINPSIGYIIGYNGAIYYTSDSGKTWQSQNSGTTLHLNSIFFLNENTGFISGRGMGGCLDPDCDKGSIFLKTSDGGNHWNKMFYDSLAYLQSMQFRDEYNGIALMECYQRPNEKSIFLVKTSDGGTTWSKTDIDVPQTYSTYIFNIQNVYYLIGEDRKILKSSDYGQTWQSNITPVTASNDIFDMYFINKDIGFITDNLKRYKTVNGGSTWQSIDNQPAWLEGLHFYSEKEGFGFSTVAVYEGGDFPTFKGTYIYSTKDGGITWSCSDLYSHFFIGYTNYPAPDIGFAVSGSVLYKITKNQIGLN